MACYEIRWKHSAERELGNLDPQEIPRIVQKVESLVENPFPQGSRKLRGAEEDYRIRVGDYRVIYPGNCASGIAPRVTREVRRASLRAGRKSWPASL